MKHLLFFAGHSSGGRAERFKKMKTFFKNLMPMLLLVAGLGMSLNVWAIGEGNSWTSYKGDAQIYFDNSKTQWENVSLMKGRWTSGYYEDSGGDKGSYGQTMSHILNTKLYYVQNQNEKHMSTLAFFGVKDWGWEQNNTVTDRATHTSGKYTNSYNEGFDGGTYLYTPANGNTDASLTKTKLSNGYSDLNKKQTVKVMVKATGQSSYVETTTFCGTITASRYTMTGASTAGSSSKTLGDDNYASGVLTSTISFAESNTTAGFTFKGWGTSSSTISKTDHTYSYTVDGEKTIYVFYEFDINVLQATSTKSDYYLHTWGGGDKGKDFYKTQLANFYIIDNGNDPIDFTKQTGFGFKNGGKDGNWVGGGSKTIAQGNTWYTGVYASNNGSITNTNMNYVSYVYFYYDGSSTSAIYLAKGYNGLSAIKTPSAGSGSNPTISKTYVTQGQSVDVTAKTAASGYHFVNWTSSNGSFGNNEQMSTTFTPSANNAQAVANYTKNTYNLSYTGSNIASCDLSSTGIFEEVITVNVTAEDRYVITEINGVTATDITGLNTQSVSFKFAVPASNVQISFTTALGQVNLNYGINDEDHGTLGATINSEPVSSGSKIDGGSDVYFTATVDAGYHLEGWYSDDQYGTKIDESVALTRTVKANDDVNVYVKVLPNTYKVTFNKNTGTGTTMTDQNFTYDVAQTLTSNTYTKTGYRFLGWNINKDAITAQYTDGQSVSNLTTVNGGTVTLYAIWEQKMYNGIAVASNNTDMGTVNLSSVSFGYTTKSASITATPKAGYYFTGWTLPANATYASGGQTNTTITVKASGDAAVSGTITANFAERWVLRGTRSDNSGDEGMPGFSTTTDIFTFATDATTGTKTVTLLPNREYKFMVYDKKDKAQRGYTSQNVKLDANVQSGSMDGTYHILMNTAGYGEYTFTVQENEQREYPKIMITNPASHLINMGTKFTTEGCATSLDGGTLTAKTTENETDFDISNGKYVREGGSVTFTAAAKTGYRFAGFYSDATCETKIQDASPYIASNITAATTVYAKFEEILKEVSVIQYDGTSEIKKVGVASHPEITAPVVKGKKFSSWSTNHVTVANASSRTTSLTGYLDGYNVYSVTATYGDLDVIYLNNLISSTWNPSEMYVYFYKGAYPDFADKGAGSQWDGGSTWAPTCMMFKGIPMTKLEGTNIWKAEYDKEDSEYFAYSSEDIKMVVFIDHEQNVYDRFKECSLVYIDFNTCMNMLMLTDNTSYKKNETALYYNKDNGAFWKNYNAESSKLYLHMHDQGGEISTTELNHAEGDEWYSCNVHLDVSGGNEAYNYYFYIGSCDGKNFSAKHTITSSESDPFELHVYDNLEDKVVLNANTTGSYKFMVTHTNDNTVKVKVEYPVYEGDYRVISIIDGDAHDNGYLYKSSTTEDEMASFYVKNGATIKLQRCSTFVGTDAVWQDVQSITMSDLPEAGAYYNFKITHNEGDASIAKDGVYVGNFYIRTDVAAGGWTDYKTNPDNILTEYSYGSDESQPFKFTHAYVNHVNANGNVQFVIANDYSKCITDTLTSDTYVTDEDGKLPNNKDANVRFMWNKTNNTIARAYIGGSAQTKDRYLILLGNKDNNDKSLMVDKNGNAFPAGGDGREGLNADEAIFTDMGNWVYQVDVKAYPGAAVKLTADFANQTQYFVGAAEGDNQWRKIMDGTDNSKSYKMRVVFDFKNNQLVAGWLPDNETITGDISLGGDMLLVRNGQETATQIKFGEASSSKVSKIQQIYGVLELNKERMTNLKNQTTQERIPLTNSSYDRCLYWISFPFRVQISKVFGGVGDYGVKWIMQKYNGQRRAEVGWFNDQNTFWEYMGEDEYLEPYVGYVLVLDANYFDEPSDEVWQNVEENVAFYFPSEDKEIDIISSASKKVTVPEHPCGINVWFDNNTKNHKNTDSHWNVIGIPAFEDLTESLEGTGKIGLNALYAWDPITNRYNVQATSGTSYVFEAMKAYMVQFAGDIDWSNASVIQKSVVSAPKYAYADNKNYMVDLFFSNGEAEDHAYIKLSEEANADFMLNEDLMKVSNSGKPNIYSYAGAYDVAFNETKMDNQSVMLGVSAPKEGTYTFSMPNQFSGTAKLVDLVEGITTDLNVSNYSVDLNKGTYNSRFQLLLEVEAKAPTSIQADGQKGREANGKTQKLLRNGNIYLINAGRVYNATGAELR